MIHVEVGLGARAYPILIESGLLGKAGPIIAPFVRNDRLILVHDRNVAAHAATLTDALSGHLGRIHHVIVEPGEGTKSWDGLKALVDDLLDLEIERSECIVALGGGVIGDLVGFAASIVKRGCGVIQVPTTLLSQVDSSVGGKTAINVPQGKNLIGAFHQPRLVLIDPGVLATLPDRELRAGYAEVLKYALIGDPDFYEWLDINLDALLARDAGALEYAIAVSVRAKAAVVAQDEHETTGARALLNFGHTFGHALEAETGFSDRLLHGEAVAAGMALAMRFSVRRGICSPDDAAKVADHLNRANLPIGARANGLNATGEILAAHMAHDKKREGGRVPFLLSRGIGDAFLAKDVQLSEVAAFLDADTV
ncbi:3-dehydroquinate synthase [Sphingomonas antarctica]|uniref:3-dehydroquinate synthase n=1 Tax=Sphingomonas antarctica TaxID=2040274 RepID=UPI0039E9DFC6